MPPAAPAPVGPPPLAAAPPKTILTLRVNGVDREVATTPNALLLDVLRDALNLTGTKRGCDMGTCGCCTVLVDGEARLACLTLAATVAGHDVRTIESLGTPEALHPVQRAFCDLGGSQCGFCTPGFVMATTALLARNPDPADGEIREALSGNLCRCTGYVKILESVKEAAREMRALKEPERAPPAVAPPKGAPR